LIFQIKNAMKTIFITGASTGLGKATALKFANSGWKVIATMRNPERGTELSSHENITIFPLDVTNSQQITQAVEFAIDMQVDVVLNNAGVGLIGPLEAYSDEQVQQQIQVNMLSVIQITRAFIPYFRQRQSGLLMATTSIAGLITFPFGAVYSATKWAVEGMYESLSFELERYNVGVKTIAPGGIASSFRDNMVIASNEAYNPAFNQMYHAFLSGKTPTKVSAAEELAEVVFEAATDGKKQIRYLAGEDAKTYVQQRLTQGAEQFRNNLAEIFFGK